MKPLQSSRELAERIRVLVINECAAEGHLSRHVFELDTEIGTLIDAWVRVREVEMTRKLCDDISVVFLAIDIAKLGTSHGLQEIKRIVRQFTIAAMGGQVEPERMQPAGEANDRS